MTRARGRVPSAILAAALSFAALASLVTAPAAAAPARYRLLTSAAYRVDVGNRNVHVGVEVAFTNTTPDPPGRYSVFDSAELAIHDGASAVTARDARGDLRVARTRASGVNVASVTLRAPLRYNQTARFRLAYDLPDGSQADVRVRASVVTLPVWSFGTRSEVTLDLPAAYTVRVAGDPMRATTTGATTRLSSGTIPDPAGWLALVSGEQATDRVTARRTVQLGGRSIELEVSSWSDDTAWGTSTADLLAEAFPRLERAIGIPYGGSGPLLVRESVAGPGNGFDAGAATSGSGIAIGFDQPRFTALHQAAHLWFGARFASDAWIREGLASHFAALVALDLKVPLPIDAAARTAQLKPDAFPLADWTISAAGRLDAYGYAASWRTIDLVAARQGAPALEAALRRITSGGSPYPITGVSAPSPASVAQPVDSRRFLDHLEGSDGQGLASLFAEQVLPRAAILELPARARARTAVTMLRSAAAGWGIPRPVRDAMDGWRFTDAQDQMTLARRFLAERDRFLPIVTAAGLSAPMRLQQRYEARGGGAESHEELRAEAAVVSAYTHATQRAAQPRSFTERIGLAVASDPESLLATANARYARGDLQGAAGAIGEAERQLDGAAAAGLTRLASTVVVLLLAVAGIALLFRRRTAAARR